MNVNSDLHSVIRNVIRSDRNCHWLMIAYYVLAVVGVIVGCALFPSDGGTIIGAGFAVGVLLLIGVTVVTRRAMRSLRSVKPDLTRVPAAALAQRKKQRRGEPAQPHSGLGGLFYVFMLVFMAAAGYLALSVNAASKASAPTQVAISSCDAGSRTQKCAAQWQVNGRTYQGDIGWANGPGTRPGLYDPEHPDVVYDASAVYVDGSTMMPGFFLLIGLPVCAWLNAIYRNESRKPWLASLKATLTQ